MPAATLDGKPLFGQDAIARVAALVVAEDYHAPPDVDTRALPPMLTRAEAAAVLGRSVGYVGGLIRAGKLVSHSRGRTPGLRKADVLRLRGSG